MKKKNILRIKSSLFLLGAIIFILIGIMIPVFFSPLDVLLLYLVVLLISFMIIICLIGMFYLFYDYKVKKSFPPNTEELKHYKEYDILTNQRFIQKNFHNFVVDVPDRWRKSYPRYGKLNPNYYPQAIMEKKEDILILDLGKINVFVDNRSIDEISFLEKFIVERGDYIVNYSENIFWLQDPYYEFVHLDFENESEQEKVSQILKENYDLKLVYEGSSGRIYKKKNKNKFVK
ncbi:MAG: hypothetical protein ACOC44_20375 [Promethearchaeia archaeon]